MGVLLHPLLLKPICKVIYACYIAVGVILGILGVLYIAYIDGFHKTIAITLIGCGVFMLLVGGVAMKAVHAEIYYLLLLVELMNVFLFIALFVLAVVGFVVVLDMKDPIRRGADQSFGLTQYRKDLWGTDYCTTNAIQTCDKSFKVSYLQVEKDILADAASWESNGGVDSAINEIFGSCALGNTYDVFHGQPSPLSHSCTECATACKEEVIADIKEKVGPATTVTFCTFAFAGFAFLANYRLLDDAFQAAGKSIHRDGGVVRLVALVLNSIVAAAGMGLTIACVYAHTVLTDECTEMDCSNFSVGIGMCIGVCTFFLGWVGAFAVHTGSKFLIYWVNLVVLVFMFLLLMVGIFLAIMSGGIDTINAESEKQYPALRQQYETVDAKYCMKDGGNLPMTHDECRAKIKDAMEGQFVPVGIIAAVVAVGFVITIYFTMKFVHSIRDAAQAEDDAEIGSPQHPLVKNPFHESNDPSNEATL
jgi:predicted membrane protein